MATPRTRQQDILLLLASIQVSIFVLVIPMLWPLFIGSVLILLSVARGEYHRQLADDEDATEQ
ncbi:hypothetical protein C482_04666 [Natrialba chahannaoensis JCM 10990]|uniref:Uncharacterized protein n=1 Tax=Natrialba chahannaoensis JCM 10990 TaxID=1227492 RepID=M0AX67_9EURY|nr:hypothetical protein [Natrialba chahannaoensis]ELZ02922.1 hypothetical protein C482_04666 [Natrialba chahannaoensis JCM 10990]